MQQKEKIREWCVYVSQIMLKHWDKFQYVLEKVGLAKEPEIEVEGAKFCKQKVAT